MGFQRLDCCVMKSREQGQGRDCLETKVALRVKETGKVCDKLVLRLFNTDTEEEEDFNGFNTQEWEEDNDQ